jgi:hypothetical protein
LTIPAGGTQPPAGILFRPLLPFQLPHVIAGETGLLDIGIGWKQVVGYRT